jgi:hypothetical protein
MHSYHVHVDRLTNQRALLTEIRRALPRGSFALVAWCDRQHGRSGPREVGIDLPPEEVRTYAASHGADYEVSINDDQLHLFYAPTPERRH